MYKIYEEWIGYKMEHGIRPITRHAEYYIGYVKEVFYLTEYFNCKPADLNILDYGMGWGEFVSIARTMGCKVIGHELSKKRINYIKSKGGDVISWDEIKKQSFNYIHSNGVFEHISNPLDTLKYLVNSLKPGGIIGIYVPNGYKMKQRMRKNGLLSKQRQKNNPELVTPLESIDYFCSGKNLNAIAPLEHVNCFNHNNLIRMGKMAGLIPVKLHGSMFIARSLKDRIKAVIKPYYKKYFNYRRQTHIYFKKPFLS